MSSRPEGIARSGGICCIAYAVALSAAEVAALTVILTERSERKDLLH